MPPSIEVQRLGFSIVGKVETSTGYGTVHQSVTCLEIAPMGAYRRVTMIGTTGGKHFRVSWETGEEILDGDRVIWNGKNYLFEYDADDQYREGGLVSAYQTGILHQEVS